MEWRLLYEADAAVDLIRFQKMWKNARGKKLRIQRLEVHLQTGQSLQTLEGEATDRYDFSSPPLVTRMSFTHVPFKMEQTIPVEVASVRKIWVSEDPKEN